MQATQIKITEGYGRKRDEDEKKKIVNKQLAGVGTVLSDEREREREREQRHRKITIGECTRVLGLNAFERKGEKGRGVGKLLLG